MNVHLIISGHVQGVGFRYSAQQKANEYNLYGWVMNMEDGRVEMEVEGPEDQVSNYIAEVKSGFHRFIKVEDIKVKKSNLKKGYTQFSIK